MAKKLVFFGKAEVGKTTLIKLYFEGESAVDLLENPLEPTMGMQTSIYGEVHQIGVFDLPGQTYKETIQNPETAFAESDVIVVVVEAQEKTKKSLKFVEQCADIRNEYAPTASVFVFFHKIDLLDESEREKLEKKLEKSKGKWEDVTLCMTSIKPDYRMETTAWMVKILEILEKYHLLDRSLDLSDIQLNSRIFDLYETQKSLDLESIAEKSGEKLGVIQPHVEKLMNEGLFKMELQDEKFVYSLTEEGEVFLDRFSKFFEDKL